MQLDARIRALQGPILVIGASGFIGANLLRSCLNQRDDVVGTYFFGDSWRLEDVPASNLAYLNLQDPISVADLFRRVQPKTVFDCSAFGAYSFEQDIERIHSTNYLSLIRVMEEVAGMPLRAYVHAGSSSEYGRNSDAPAESAELLPNSHYAVSKAAAGQAIVYYGKERGVPVVNLRLYSVYGPYEDSSRLIPAICQQSLEGKLPLLAAPGTTRDFIHIDDVVAAFVLSALEMSPKLAGESVNIGSGTATSLAELASLAQSLFGILSEPEYRSDVARAWDVPNWSADIRKARELLGWEPAVSLADGIRSTRAWWNSFLLRKEFSQLSKKDLPGRSKSSVSAIVACYKDEQAIPVMHNRLVKVFAALGVDYEIIFVNDGSPDNSAEVIRQISALDPHVIGITHSRNFGSQAAFRSGLELASKEACVLLDGDLQDPPELIEAFVAAWRDGADVVYGRRTKREMPLPLEFFYRAFYWIFAAISEVPVPKNAGDFALMDRAVVYWLLQFQERDMFLRGLRAYVGFTQVGVDYVRPERPFGASTNNWISNIGWAKKGLFSFSRTPLHIMTTFGFLACIATALVAVFSVTVRIIAPEEVPRGITFLSLLVMFFGSTTILSIGLLGEYIGKIFEETKARPTFIRKSLIRRGEVESVRNIKWGRL